MRRADKLSAVDELTRVLRPLVGDFIGGNSPESILYHEELSRFIIIWWTKVLLRSCNGKDQIRLKCNLLPTDSNSEFKIWEEELLPKGISSFAAAALLKMLYQEVSAPIYLSGGQVFDSGKQIMFQSYDEDYYE